MDLEALKVFQTVTVFIYRKDTFVPTALIKFIDMFSDEKIF
ncbi:hypothetical protein [Clostridium sp. DJ247]|nr:hypothetical protein [Clostridium sp. DJ247]